MDLLENPFYVLSVTQRDTRLKILEMADERSLTLDPNTCIRARSDLTNPRKRLSSEVAWLLGLHPKRTQGLLETLANSPFKVIKTNDLGPIARCNLLAAGILRISFTSPEVIAEWITEIAWSFEDFDADDVRSTINEERVAAGFSEITDMTAIESALEERRLWYRKAIKSALDTLPARDLVAAVTFTVENATNNGEEQGPVLIDDLVNAYEVEAQEFLDKESKNIIALVEELRTDVDAKRPEDALALTVNQISHVVRNWDSVAQPIQLSMKSQGLNHEKSREIGNLLRELAVELFNEHEYLQFSQQITNLLKELFIEVVDVAEQVLEDARTLENIAKQRQKQEKEIQEWRKEITYEAKIGSLFGSSLKISPKGIEWQGRHWNLDDIKGIRWGGTRRYFNGIYTGTDFLVYFSDSSSHASISLQSEDIFKNFTRCLWSAVGVRLVTECLEGLHNGRDFHFGNMVLKDTGVTLFRRRFFGSLEPKFCPWNEITIWNSPGVFCIGKKDERKFSETLSYQEQDNIHVLETCIRLLLGCKTIPIRMSSLLER